MLPVLPLEQVQSLAIHKALTAALDVGEKKASPYEGHAAPDGFVNLAFVLSIVITLVPLTLTNVPQGTGKIYQPFCCVGDADPSVICISTAGKLSA